MKIFIFICLMIFVGLESNAGNFKVIDSSKQDTITSPTGLRYIIIAPGTGDKVVQKGQTVSVHYTGKFVNGEKFDSSIDRNEPITFEVGIGRVIKGWDEGLLGMKVGEKRKLLIPYQLAYGENGRGTIPPKSDLYFDVEIVEIK